MIMTSTWTHASSTTAPDATAAAPAASISVLHSVPGSWLESTQTWLYEQIRALPGDVHNQIVCPRTQNLDRFWLPNIYDESKQPGWKRAKHRWSGRFGRRRHSQYTLDVAGSSGASVLHSHFGYQGWRDLDIAQRLGLKHVVTFYGLDVSYLPRHGWARRYRELFERVHLVLCEGPHMAQSIVDLGCSPKKVLVHHLGVDLEKVTFQPRQWDGTTPLRCLISASFREKKGIPFAIEALGHIGKSHPIEVTIIGDAGASKASRHEKKKIVRAINKWKLDDRVRMLGFQPHEVLLEEAAKHHVFLQPSVTARNGDTEGGAPVCLLEMMASGLICIGSTHCDIPEIIQPGETGFLANERDVNGLVQCLLVVIGARGGGWEAIQQRARSHIKREFDSLKQGQHLASIYRQLIGA